MPQYMLVLRDDPKIFAKLSPEEIQRVIQKYKAWGDSLRTRGLLAGSAKLTDGAGRLMRRESGRVRITDGPYSEAKEVFGGYFTIQADSYDQAVERCRDCPHLEFGSIEIREVDVV
jgi:hypothetical protein